MTAKVPEPISLVDKALTEMRKPFPPHHISKLPKPTKAQTDAVKANYRSGERCHICGSWHHPDVIHLDYVGHAALTDRLLDADPAWYWEPFAIGQDGLPALDRNGGLWIRLYIVGASRIGYGSADGKSGGDAIKEIIGDALRNAAMRFGAALDLWHKGELHIYDDAAPDQAETSDNSVRDNDDLTPPGGWGDWARSFIGEINSAPDAARLDTLRDDNKRIVNASKKEDMAIYNAIGAAFTGRRAALAGEVPA